MGPAFLGSVFERRVQRSDEPAEAASYYLDAVRERCQMQSIVLAELGAVVASSSSPLEPDQEHARLVALGEAIVLGDPDAGLSDSDIYAHAFSAASRKFLLVSVGRRIDALKRAIADLERIVDS
jgi:hypothetical protein